jgi:hypothetical protein
MLLKDGTVGNLGGGEKLDWSGKRAAPPPPPNERSEINVGSGVRGQAGLGEY